MPPEKKKVIKAFKEAICENCLLSTKSESENFFCFKSYAGISPIVTPTSFCDSGLWYIVVAQDRISTVSFETVCGYLE